MGLVAFVLALVILAAYGIDKLDNQGLEEAKQRAEVAYQREEDDTASKKTLTGNPCSPTFAAPIPSQNDHAGTIILMGKTIDWNEPAVYQLKILTDRVEIWAEAPGKTPLKLGEKFPANSPHCRQIRAAQ